MIALVVITDGRIDYLRQTIASAEEMLHAEWGARIIVDDSGDPDHAATIAAEWPRWATISHLHRLGFAATVRTAWQAVIDAGVTHAVHLEEDFTFVQPLDVEALRELLDDQPDLAQLALKRQPVNPVEEAAGGLMGMWPLSARWQRPGFVEHIVTFTTNPSLIPARVIRRALANETPLTEPEITRHLLYEGYRFGYVGRLDDPPLVIHIGEHRMAGWRQ